MRTTRRLPALRPYQESVVETVIDKFESGSRAVMLQMPTGAGKTIVFSHLIALLLEHNPVALQRDCASSAESQVVVLAHRKELVEQAHTKLSLYVDPSDIGIVRAGVTPDYDRPIQVASVQSLSRRIDKSLDPDRVALVVVDEAHHAASPSYQAILKAFPQAIVLGVSATPHRLDGKPLDTFDELVLGPSARELREDGYLSPLKVFATPTLLPGKTRVRGGDYDLRQLADSTNLVQLSGSVVDTWLRLAKDRRTIVFCINTKHSRTLAEQFNQAGVESAHIDGTTPEVERQQILNDFADGSIRVLTNCQIATEGFDLPDIDCVVCARPTLSRVLWFQMIGRGTRPAEGKENCIVIDHTGNAQQHWTPYQFNHWSLDGEDTKPLKAKRVKAEIASQVSGDSTSRTVIESTGEVVQELDLEALFRSEKKRQAKEHREQDLESELAVLLRRCKMSGYKRGWVYFQMLKRPWPLELWKYAESALGYKRGWGRHQYRAQQESEFPWQQVSA